MSFLKTLAVCACLSLVFSAPTFAKSGKSAKYKKAKISQSQQKKRDIASVKMAKKKKSTKHKRTY